MGAQRGFTLIEVMMVVAILGIVAAISVPRVSSMIETRKAGNELKKVIAVLNKTRDEAREERRCILVTSTANTLTMQKELVTSAGACDAGNNDGAATTTTFNDDLVSIGTLTVRFNQNGGVDGTTADTTPLVVTTSFAGTTRTNNLVIYTLLGLIRAQ